jgi:hypothetical protein
LQHGGLEAVLAYGSNGALITPMTEVMLCQAASFPLHGRAMRGKFQFIAPTRPRINRMTLRTSLPDIGTFRPRLLYPFGYGLSYSTFSISDHHLSARSSPLSGSITATVTVANTGTRAADEVVQLYLHQRFGSASRPVRELKGFRRVTLQPGQKQEISFTVGGNERNYWSAAKNGWVVEPSDFDVWVGNSSLATLHDSFSVVQ